MADSVFNELKWRGFIAQATHADDLARLLDEKPLSFYVGFDPTARSLHLGHLVPILGMMRLQKAGHTPIALIGGATGMVGDPSGKSEERNLLTTEVVHENAAGVREQLGRFLDFDSKLRNAARMVNNSDWISKLSCIEWLREVGKYFTVKDMLEKDSVKSRLEREQTLSYTEFSYMIMQAYDFLHLFDAHGCLLQAGGDDQWGNITMGISYVQKLRQKQAYGLTFPLLTTSTGRKFGKTEKGTQVWLDPALTTPYKFYQYFINTDDKDAVPFLKLFTFLGQEEIDRLGTEAAAAPQERKAQKTLAREITTLVHGAEQAEKVAKASEVIFSEEIRGIPQDIFMEVFADAHALTLPLEALKSAAPLTLVDVLVQSSLAKSKNDARRLLDQGGVYLNNRKAGGSGSSVKTEELLFGRFLLIRKGKKETCLVKFA